MTNFLSFQFVAVYEGNRYEYPSRCPQLLEKELIYYEHEIQNLAIMLLLNIKAIYYITCRVKLRQTWIAEVGFIVLNQLIRTRILSPSKDH